MITIGLTGSIGMGKSTVAKMFEDLGIPVHDSDLTVHKLLGADGGAVRAVGDAFPAALETNDQGQKFINRKTLGRIVFADPAKLKTLEGILHPLVRQDSEKFKAAMKDAGKPIVALDIPLLFETAGESRVDVIVVVSAPPEVQKARVLARPGMTEERLAGVLKTQMPDVEKRARAHCVIETGISLDETKKQVAAFVSTLGRKPPSPSNKLDF